MNITLELDTLDRLGASAFDGYLVRKDLVRKYSRQYPVPTYVVEFLLGRYCATVNETEISEGLQIVERQLKDRTVRTGEEELFKAKSRDKGSVKLIDIVKAKLDAKNDCYVAEVPSLALRDVRIDDNLVREHERMLTDGFYAEITLGYDALVAQERNGRPFSIDALRPIQMSKSDVLDVLARGRQAFSSELWRHFLIRSIGLEPEHLTERAIWVCLLRMVPFVERNFNMVELGPRGTGKSHLFQQISPYSHLISGGKATVAKMFVNNANGQRGLVCQYDVVCFDEVSGVSFDQKDGVNIMKGYMASGEFSRGKDSIRAEGGIVMVGNFDVDIEQQQRIGHLLSPLPPEMRDDTAFHDRLHAFVPGWDFPKLNPNEHLTNHFGLVSDFLSECWNKLRPSSRVSALQGRVHFGGALSGRDIEAVNKSISGLLKLLFPDPSMPVPDDDLEEIVRIAFESRRRVKEQQKRCLKSEFRNTHFSYTMGTEGIEKFVATPELHSDDASTRTGLGHQPRFSGSGSWLVSHRSDRWPWKRRSEDSEHTRSGWLPRKCEGWRTELVQPGKEAGRRPRPQSARIQHPDACDGQRPQRSGSRLAGAGRVGQFVARTKHQRRDDPGWLTESRRLSRADSERSFDCRSRHREASDNAADARRRPTATE
jgi:ATP-dependent Lon protease